MAAGDLRQMSLEEYLPLDRASDEKREYAFNEAFAMELSSRSEDFREGFAAWREQRDPDFRGR